MWFKEKYVQFSKIILAAFSAMWFITGFYGMVFCWVNPGAGITDLLLFVGIPMTGGVVSYYINSAVEKKNRKEKNDANEVV